MKTPEEIKKGLELCEADDCYEEKHTGCPYDDDELCIRHLCGNALAYINQLESRVPKWISVKDRVPNPSTYVLALTAPGALNVGQNVIVADYIHPKREEHGVFVIAYTPYADQYILPVTHWMPLPPLPKEE